MIWLYLRSGSPFLTARVRILWPGGTRVAARDLALDRGAGQDVHARHDDVVGGMQADGERCGHVVLSVRLGGALGADSVDGGAELADVGLAERRAAARACGSRRPDRCGAGRPAPSPRLSRHRAAPASTMALTLRLLDAVDQAQHQVGRDVGEAGDGARGAESSWPVASRRSSPIRMCSSPCCFSSACALSQSPDEILHAGDLLREGLLQPADQRHREADRRSPAGYDRG